jgi:hypothetical protein
MGGSAYAQVSTTDWQISATTAKTTKAKRAKKSKAAKSNVSFHNGSAETTPDRERRLRRECQGRANSGLCEGFTR